METAVMFILDLAKRDLLTALILLAFAVFVTAALGRRAYDLVVALRARRRPPATTPEPADEDAIDKPGDEAP
jgi:hypothetical protein